MAESRNRADEELEEADQIIEQVWSWGAGTDGQLGTGSLRDEHHPQLLHLPSLSAASPISIIACGGAHAVILTSSGKVLAWGRGTSGQLGHGQMESSLVPKPVLGLESYFITHVAAGWSHSGFVSDAGCVFTCGDGSFGQLGHGDYRSHCSPVKVPFFLNSHVQEIACGMRHSLVLLKGCSQHQVYGFGSAKRGQLGISTKSIKSVNLPHAVCGFEGVELISVLANGDHSAALSADGRIYTWGRGFNGSVDAHVPECLHCPLLFAKAALGWNHALLLSGEGDAFMLGGSHHGMLANSQKIIMLKQLSGEAALQKVPRLDGTKVTQVAAGAEHSAIVTGGGEIMTWGWGEHGQLGLGNIEDQTEPRTVSLDNESPETDVELRVYCGSGFTFIIRRFISASASKATIV